jgi:hypothetical protein
MKTFKFTISAYNKDSVVDSVNEANKKAKKLTKSDDFIALEMSDPYLREGDGWVIDVNASCLDFFFKIPGYEVLGGISNKGIVDGTPVNMITAREEENLSRFALALPQDIPCEHCGTNRRRRHWVVVRNTETNKEIVLGKTCAEDYTGHSVHDALSAINFFGEFSENILEIAERDEEERSGGFWPNSFQKVLSASSYALREAMERTPGDERFMDYYYDTALAILSGGLKSEDVKFKELIQRSIDFYDAAAS